MNACDDKCRQEDHFDCELCGGNFHKSWSDEQQKEESDRLFPDLNIDDPEETAIVCDDCFKELMGFYGRLDEV